MFRHSKENAMQKYLSLHSLIINRQQRDSGNKQRDDIR
jgi:hypothetical protein